MLQMAANKFLTDIDDYAFHTNEVWAHTSGMSLGTINKLELQMLQHMVRPSGRPELCSHRSSQDWNMAVSQSAIEQFTTSLSSVYVFHRLLESFLKATA